MNDIRITKVTAFTRWIYMTVAVVAACLSFSAFSKQNGDSDGSSINGQQCEVSLNYDLQVEGDTLIVSENKNERYRIEGDKLFIDSRQVALNGEQQALLEQYQQQVAQQLPEVIAVVEDALEIAASASSMALTPLLGDSAGAKLDTLMAGLKERVGKVAYQQGDRFYLGSTEGSLEQTFDEEFEQEFEELVKNSIGSLMINLGSQMLNSDGENFEQKIEEFASKMDSIGEEVEAQIEQQAQSLETRAEALCADFQDLMATEEALRNSVPQLQPYPLVTQKQQHKLK